MGEASLKLPAYGWAARDASGVMSPYSFKRRECGPKDVKLDVKFCGVCHTDMHMTHNDWGNSLYPLVPGHEIVGIVTEVGVEVTKFKVGDHCGVGCMVESCGKCESCDQSLENYCMTRMVQTYGDVQYDGTPTLGGYSNFMVTDEKFVLKMPKNLPLDKAAPLLCAGITVYSPMAHFRLGENGKNFAVIGLGGLGHMAAKIAKAKGMTVTVISTSPSKEKEARENLMADHFIVSNDEAQMKAAAASLDFIIDTVSAPHAVDPYLQLLKVNGKLILVGIPPHVMEIPPSTLIFGRKMVGGSLIGGLRETQEMLDFCGEHNVTCEIEKIPMSYINEAFKRLVKSDVHYRFVIEIADTLKKPE